jgi:hypothetical protein
LTFRQSDLSAVTNNSVHVVFVCSKGRVHHSHFYTSIEHCNTKCHLQNTTSLSGIGYISLNLESIDIGTYLIILPNERNLVQCTSLVFPFLHPAIDFFSLKTRKSILFIHTSVYESIQGMSQAAFKNISSVTVNCSDCHCQSTNATRQQFWDVGQV